MAEIMMVVRIDTETLQVHAKGVVGHLFKTALNIAESYPEQVAILSWHETDSALLTFECLDDKGKHTPKYELSIRRGAIPVKKC